MKTNKPRAGVSFDHDTFERAKAAAERDYKGNLSALIDAALRAYVEQGAPMPSPSDENCLVQLSERFTPWDVHRMRKACESLHQPTELASMLLAFSGGEAQLSEAFLAVAEKRGTYKRKHHEE